MRAEAAEAILLTAFLKHDQSRNLTDSETAGGARPLESIPCRRDHGGKLVIMMGIGQVVTLEVPASKLRDVNGALEKTAWKAFRTEFYPTYDLYPLIRVKLAKPAKKSP
jgi:hypothetical protein